jgi:hypothetical protein
LDTISFFETLLPFARDMIGFFGAIYLLLLPAKNGLPLAF